MITLDRPDFIKRKFYIATEVIKALILIGFFLYGLHKLATVYGYPVYPINRYELLLLYTFLSFLILSWFLGEREKQFLFFSYISTFQIIGLAFILKDFQVIIRILTPLMLTYASLFLFKSPAEYLAELKQKEVEKIKQKLIELKERIKLYEEELIRLKAEYERIIEEKAKLEKLYRESEIESLKELLKQKELTEYEYKRKIEELERRIATLKENNQRLWDLLEEAIETSKEKGSSELKRLRKERKKLLKENLSLKEKLGEMEEHVKILEIDLEELSKQNKILYTKNRELEELVQTLKSEILNLEKTCRKNIVKYLDIFFERIKFKPRALSDFENLDDIIKERVIKTLKKLDKEGSSLKLEKLKGTEREILKMKFSGGRIYLSREGNAFYVEGILQGEDEKSKSRFIRERYT